MANLLAKKPLESIMSEVRETGEHSLTRALGPLNLVTLGIGAVIGAGIFVITGQVAALYAGPAVPLSMVLVGVACAFAGLCYAEMASAVPVAGSAYTYSYATIGEFAAWIIGWDLVLEYAAGASTVGVGQLRLVRGATGCGLGVLLLHRVRCGLDRGAGIEESPTRHAHRHPRLARDLHALVYRGVGRAGGRGPLRRAQPPGTDGLRDGADRRAVVDSCLDRRRRGPGHRLRDPRDAAGTVPCFLFNVSRWLTRPLGQQSASAVPHAVPLHDLHWHRGVRC